MKSVGGLNASGKYPTLSVGFLFFPIYIINMLKKLKFNILTKDSNGVCLKDIARFDLDCPYLIITSDCSTGSDAWKSTALNIRELDKLIDDLNKIRDLMDEYALINGNMV
jgi:hypothetical protein